MFASQLSTHINEKGDKAILVFVFPGKAPLPFTGETRHLNGSPKKRMWDLKAWRNLARIIKEERPDVVQANAGDTLKYAVLSKLFFKWKQPIVFRNASTISLYIKTTPAKLLNGFFFKYASRIVSVSRTSATDFANLFPQFKERIVTVPIGIEEAVLNDPAKENVLPGASKPVLVHVGGFSFEKNHVRLIEIFESILKKQPSASLHFVGSGPLQGQIEELVKQKGLQQQIHFYGFRNDAIQFIKNADALLLPSRPLVGAKVFTIEAIFRPDGGDFEQRWMHIAETNPATGLDTASPERVAGGTDANPRFMFELRAKDGNWYLDAFFNSKGPSQALIFPDKLHPVGRWYAVTRAQCDPGSTFWTRYLDTSCLPRI